jgi:hypothetical protein
MSNVILVTGKGSRISLKGSKLYKEVKLGFKLKGLNNI